MASDRSITCAGRGASSGVGFAIPIDTVTGLVEQILKFGRVVRPVLGITIAPPQTIRQLNVEGILILDIPAGSPADIAGLKGTSRYMTDSYQDHLTFSEPPAVVTFNGQRELAGPFQGIVMPSCQLHRAAGAGQGCDFLHCI